jgi:hypothetical protein
MGVDFLDFLRSAEKDIHASRKAGAGADDGRKPTKWTVCGQMRFPALVVSRDRYDIESLMQKKPNGFKPALLNAAAARHVK